jgi:hypothetical protein
LFSIQSLSRHLPSLKGGLIGAALLSTVLLPAAAHAQFVPAPNPGRLALRGGLLLGDRTGAVLGIDAPAEKVRVSDIFAGRVDLEFWSDLSIFNEETDGFSLMLSQLTTQSGVPNTPYYGFGVGYNRLDQGRRDDHSGLAAKLIVGFNTTAAFGVEGNLHVMSGGPKFSVVGRFRL